MEKPTILIDKPASKSLRKSLPACASIVLAATAILGQIQVPCLAQSQSSTSEAPERVVSTEKITKPTFLQGSVDAFGVLTDPIQNSIGIQCRKSGANTLIDSVRPGSLSALSGLRAGDVVLDASVENDTAFIKIKRNGNVYGARIALTRGAYQAQIPSPAVTETIRQNLDSNQFMLRAETTVALSKYKLELIIDRSLTMRRTDCPNGLSRWDWCAYQTEEIARALATLAPEGIAISRFAGDFDTLENAGPEAVSATLRTHDFQLGTRLAEPLEARLNNFFARQKTGDKPLLIAVITDGCPAPRPEPMLVRQVLYNASKRIRRPGDVAIVFLQIGGDDIRGQNYLLSLSNDQRFAVSGKPFIFTRTFNELLQVGLARALGDAVVRQSSQQNYFTSPQLGSSARYAPL